MATHGTQAPAAPHLPGIRTRGNAIAGRYRVEERLGTGASGFVVAARHVTSRRRVALKIFSSTHPTRHRDRQRAAQRAATLRGEHVARVVETGFTEDGIPFVATEWLDGHTLADELEARTQLPVGEAVRWVLEACVGLAEAHAAGIVHGGLKPRNLFLAEVPGSEERTLKILDFGAPMPLADDDGTEASTAWFASPAYLAPEQLRASDAADARADIWALGILLHQLVSGTLPFSAETVAGALVAVACDEPALLTAQAAPFDLARAVKACLAKDPAERPESVAVLARMLAPFADDGQALATRVEEVLSAPPPRATLEEPSDAPSGERSAGAAEGWRKGLRSGGAHHAAARRRFARRLLAAMLLVGTVAVAAAVALAPARPGVPQPERNQGAEARPEPAASTAEAPSPSPARSLHAPGPPAEARADPDEGARFADPVSAPSSAAKPAARSRPKAPPWRKAAAAPAALAADRKAAPTRVKSRLPVREAPYAAGFTHPRHLKAERAAK